MPNRVPNKTRITFRALASVYIMYLGYTLFRGFKDVPVNQKLFIGIAAVAFLVVPLYFLYTCWKEYKEIEAAEKEQAREAMQSDTALDDGDGRDDDALDDAFGNERGRRGAEADDDADDGDFDADGDGGGFDGDSGGDCGGDSGGGSDD